MFRPTALRTRILASTDIAVTDGLKYARFEPMLTLLIPVGKFSERHYIKVINFSNALLMTP